MVRSTGVSAETSTPSGFLYRSGQRQNSDEYTLSLINSAESRPDEDHSSPMMYEESKEPAIQEFDPCEHDDDVSSSQTGGDGEHTF